MRFGLGLDRPMHVVPSYGVRNAAMLLTSVVLLIAAAGCGGGNSEHKTAGMPSGGDSSGMANNNVTHEAKASPAPAASNTHGAATGTAQHEASHSESGNRVRLILAKCVQFEPHWITIQQGQSLTWSSEMKSTVTIHVPSGVFEKTEYVVPAGKSVSSGPARTVGSYAMSSTPAACQGAPRGVYGAGPGVTVEASPQR